MLNKEGPGKQEQLLLFIGLIGLVALMLIYNKSPFYDETPYLQNVALLQQYGFSNAYLLKHIGSAGPLYSSLHYLLEPLTKLQTPYIRLVNVVLLIGTIWFSGQTLKKLGFSPSFAWLALAIPMTYVISGLALTEMPAIFFFSLGIFLIVEVRSADRSFIIDAFKLAIAGLAISFAILGRQPFLLVLGALPVLFFKKGKYMRNSALLLITMIFSLALPSYIFFIWGGLVAPGDGAIYNAIAEEGVSLQPAFFFLCVAYYAVVFFIVTPGFFIRPDKKELFYITLLTLLLVALNFKYRYFLSLPMRHLMESIFPSVVIGWGETIFGAAIFLAGLYFIINLIRQLAKHNYPTELVFFAFAAILIAVACIKITWGFSSRYPAQALPFLLPLFAYFYKKNRFTIYRLGAGVLLGLISFASYIAMVFD